MVSADYDSQSPPLFTTSGFASKTWSKAQATGRLTASEANSYKRQNQQDFYQASCPLFEHFFSSP
jgi:hypothetical protein